MMKMGILGLIFVVLFCAKLLGFADSLSWWWVMSPLLVWMVAVGLLFVLTVASAMRK